MSNFPLIFSLTSYFLGLIVVSMTFFINMEKFIDKSRVSFKIARLLFLIAAVDSLSMLIYFYTQVL